MSNILICVCIVRYNMSVRRGARVVELARLERVCGSNVTQGSNPCLSAKSTTFSVVNIKQTLDFYFLGWFQKLVVKICQRLAKHICSVHNAVQTLHM